MKFVLTILILIQNFSSLADTSSLNVFETDYCTNYPEGPAAKPDLWKHCCLIHDMYFWAGGNKDDRNNADLELKACIEQTGSPEQARIMYLAVRAGSYSPIKYPKRKWGNGWIDRASHKRLSTEETLIIEQDLHSGYDFISSEIKNHFINSLYSRLEN